MTFYTLKPMKGEPVSRKVFYELTDQTAKVTHLPKFLVRWVLGKALKIEDFWFKIEFRKEF